MTAITLTVGDLGGGSTGYYVVGFAIRGDGGNLVDIDIGTGTNAAASTSISPDWREG